MRVILKQDVPSLGDAGEIVSVSGGYGRNYLIPNGLAIPASEGSVAELEHHQRIAEAIRRKHRASVEALAEKLNGTAVNIRREAGEDDRLFGSVTNRDIADALAAEGIEVDRKSIQLADPIRAIGIFTVDVRLARDLSAAVKVYVTKDN